MKVEKGRLKAEDALKNKDHELQSALVVSGNANEELKTAREVHDQMLW